MANTYCTATNTGKGFFTHEDRNDFYLSGHAGDVWVVGNNAAGVSWINRVSGTAKVKAEAQAIVDGKIDEAIVAYDAQPAEYKAAHPKPVKYTLPQDLTMATYKGIKGVKVQSLASDPTASETVGKVWYNTASNALKYSTEGSGAWASAATGNAARQAVASAGTQTTAWIAAGEPAPVGDNYEQYDGTSWTQATVLNTGKDGRRAAGTQTAGIVAGGFSMSETESWNGSSWTVVNAMPTNKFAGGSCGTSTAMLYAGGLPATAAVEEWNGTSWSEGTSVNTAKGYQGSFGTSTASIQAGGNYPVYITAVEEWNGTSWTEITDLSVGISYEPAGFGNTTDGIIAGGTGPVITATTEKWNGTSWTEVGDLGTARRLLGGSTGATGGTTAGLAFFGSTPAITAVSEAWDSPNYVAKTVTVS